MAKKSLWLGSDDKLDILKSNRGVAAVLDGSATAATGARLPITVKLTLVVDPGSVAADDLLEVNVPATGALVGDGVIAIPPTTLAAGLNYQAFVQAADVIKLRISNHTAAPIDPASATWNFILVRS